MASGSSRRSRCCWRHQPQFRLVCSPPTAPLSSRATEWPSLGEVIGGGTAGHAGANHDDIDRRRQLVVTHDRLNGYGHGASLACFTGWNRARYLRHLQGAPNGPEFRQRGNRLPAGSSRLAEGEPDARDHGRDQGRPECLHAERAPDRLAEAPGEEGLAVHRLAQGIRRPGLHHDAEVHIRDGDGQGACARHVAIRAQDVRAGDHEVWLGRAEGAGTCRRC